MFFSPARVRSLAFLLSVTFGSLYCPPAFADFCNAPASQGPRHEYQFLAGYSPASATLVGTTENRRFAQAGFAYSYRCWRTGGVDISPTATILPIATVFQPEYRVAGRRIAAHSVHGVSVLPLGFTFDVKPAARLGVFGETHGGIIVSAEPIPIDAPNATGLNFIFDFGGGARWRPTDTYALRIGYRFVHISNGQTIAVNPGLDNNVMYASFSLLR